MLVLYSLGPDGIGSGTSVVLPPFALLHKVRAANELDTECVAVRLGVTDRREEVLRLASEVRLIRPAVRVSARPCALSTNSLMHGDFHVQDERAVPLRADTAERLPWWPVELLREEEGVRVQSGLVPSVFGVDHELDSGWG